MLSRIMLSFCIGILLLPMDSLLKEPVKQYFDVFFVVNLNRLLKKQLSGQWLDTP